MKWMKYEFKWIYKVNEIYEVNLIYKVKWTWNDLHKKLNEYTK